MSGSPSAGIKVRGESGEKREGGERKREGDTYNCIERTVERHREGQRQGTKVDKTLVRGPALGTVLGTSNAFLGGRTLLWLFC